MTVSRSAMWPDDVVDRASKRYYECGGAARPVGHHTRDWMRSALEASGAVFLTDAEREALMRSTDPNDRDPDVQSAREKIRGSDA